MKRNHKERKDRLKVHKVNPCYPCAIFFVCFVKILCALCGKAKRNHKERKGRLKVHKVNPCKTCSIRVFRVRFREFLAYLTSPCRCATSLSFHKERDVLATPKQGEVKFVLYVEKKPQRTRREKVNLCNSSLLTSHYSLRSVCSFFVHMKNKSPIQSRATQETTTSC